MQTLEYQPVSKRSRSILHVLIVIDTVVTAAVICYCYIGIRLAQWYEGSEMLWPYLTGTDRYDHWLIGVPAGLYTLFQISLGIWTIVVAVLRRWPPEALWILPILFIEWLIFLFVCFPIFDEASP